MNIYLITFDFSGEYGIAHCIVAAKDEAEAKAFANYCSDGAFYPIESVTLLDPAQYPDGGFIKDMVFIG